MTRWWFQTFFIFIPNFGEDEPISTNLYFSIGLVKNHQLDDGTAYKSMVILLARPIHRLSIRNPQKSSSDFPNTKDDRNILEVWA